MTGQNSKWEMQGDYAVSFTTNKTVFGEGILNIPKDLRVFFGADQREKRVVLLFEGREYPTYIEAQAGEGNYIMTWSKALTSKFLGLFPDYEHFFDENSDHEEIIPKLYLEKIEESEYIVKITIPQDSGLALKQSLFDFIGPGNSLASFKDSYELLFLKYYLELVDNRWRSDVFMVSANVQKYYLDRVSQGKEQDKNANKIIENIQNAGLDDVLAFLMEFPYFEYAQKGFLLMETVEEHFYFSLEPKLIDELSTDDRRLIIEMLDQKIEYYFGRIDGPGLQENFTSLVNEYATYFTRDFRYSFKDIVTSAIPGCIDGLQFVSSSRYKMIGFVGVEEWAEIPWISIVDKNITRFANTGVYVQYLLNKDARKLYLTLSHGYKDIEDEVRKKGLENEKSIVMAMVDALDVEVQKIQGMIEPQGFDIDNKKVDLSDLRLQAGVVCYREYEGVIPGDGVLEADLASMLEVYNQYYERCILEIPFEQPKTDEEVQNEIMPEATDEEIMEETFVVEDIQDDLEGEVLEEFFEVVDEEALNDEKALKEIEIIKVDENREENSVVVPKVKQKVETKQVPLGYGGVQLDPQTLKSIQKFFEQGFSGGTRPFNKGKRGIKRTENPEGQPTNFSGVLKQVVDFMNYHGCAVTLEMVQDFYLNIKTKPILLLAGGGGINKSQFVGLFAKAMGMDGDNKRYFHLVAQEQWQDSKPLWGKLDEKGQFLSGAIIDFVVDAIDHPHLPFMLCVDELNSEILERCFGEVMSVLCTRFKTDDGIKSYPLLGDEVFGRDEEARNYYKDLYFPGNLVIVGNLNTVNQKEGLKRRIIENMGLMELGDIPLTLGGVPDLPPMAQNLSSGFLQSEHLILSQTVNHRNMVNEVISLLEAMNGILKEVNAQVGLSARDEICFYLLYNAEYGFMSQEVAFDHAILEKVLPKIQGSGDDVMAVIIGLFKICAGTRSNNAIRNYSATMGGLFPKSAEKLSAMALNLEKNGMALYL